MRNLSLFNGLKEQPCCDVFNDIFFISKIIFWCCEQIFLSSTSHTVYYQVAYIYQVQVVVHVDIDIILQLFIAQMERSCLVDILRHKKMKNIYY